MSTKKANQETPVNGDNKKTITVSAKKFAAGAKSISEVTDKWTGVKPSDIQDGLSSQDLPQRDIKSLLDVPLTVIGFQKRKGMLKGKESEFLIVLAVPDSDENCIVFVCGGSVVRKKLESAAAENSLPIHGHLVETEGTDYTYFDFVS